VTGEGMDGTQIFMIFMMDHDFFASASSIQSEFGFFQKRGWRYYYISDKDLRVFQSLVKKS